MTGDKAHRSLTIRFVKNNDHGELYIASPWSSATAEVINNSPNIYSPNIYLMISIDAAECKVVTNEDVFAPGHSKSIFKIIIRKLV